MALRTQLTAVYRGVRSVLARRLFVDRRALVALRVSLGALLLADLLLRARSLTFFYADAGALPRSILFIRYPITATLSVHTWFGDPWWVTLLLVAAGVAALALVFGYRTKAAAVCSLVLLVSLHARNPLVLNGGDSLLRRTLLWSLFVPLGSGLVLDDRTRCRHPAAVALLILYLVNAVIKLRGDAWPSGRAIRTGVQYRLADCPPRRATRGVSGSACRTRYRMGGPIVLFAAVRAHHGPETNSRRRRVRGRAHGDGVHTRGRVVPARQSRRVAPVSSPGRVGVDRKAVESGRSDGGERFDGWAGWAVGTTRAVEPESTIGRTPTGRMIRSGRRLRRRLSAGVRADLAALDPALSALGGVVPGRVESGDTRRKARSLLGPVDRTWIAAAVERTGRSVATALLVVVVLWNAAALGYVDVPETDAIGVSPQETRWDMFAPSPPTEDVWYVAVGRLESGEKVDVIHGGDPSLQRSDRRWSTYPSARWRKYLEVVRWTGDDALRERFASALCTRWNATHRTHVETHTIHVLSQPTRLNTTEPVEEVRVRTHTC
ncbi:hypothetical protein [Halobaculum rubrum]|uniref:hypothetical protein n=1 Tax=Halobaculum rubrum TaxID=2872158 RepID=UPI001CA46CFF|nr:hypothetical protein [Halobaculum rubrum]QZX99423.1 hypothetical protein K6T25_14430 [Halobaculum rubrum]